MAVRKDEIPSRPRAWASVPAEPSDLKDILELIQLGNEELPTGTNMSIPGMCSDLDSWISQSLRLVQILQINLHLSTAASAALIQRLYEKAKELVLVQDPCIVGDRICGVKSLNRYHQKKVGPGLVFWLRKTFLIIIPLNIATRTRSASM